MPQPQEPPATGREGSGVIDSGQGPADPRRRLRAEIRKARQGAGLTQEEVAAAMDWSLSKVIRIENGSVGISTNDLKALLSLHGIADTERAGELLALVRAARERSWWSGYRDVASPQHLRNIEDEAAASVMRAFRPYLIPGLLQTEEYARAVLHRYYERPTAEPLDRLVELRMRRQELLDRPDPPRLFFVLDEAVAHRAVGGTTVMHHQIRRLIEMTARPNVTVEVIPFSAGFRAAMANPFCIMEFPDATDDPVVYLESNKMIKEDIPEEVVFYREEFERLRDMSLRAEGTVTFLSEIADEMA